MEMILGLILGSAVGSILCYFYMRLRIQSTMLEAQNQGLALRGDFEQQKLTLVRELEAWKAKFETLSQGLTEREDTLQSLKQENAELTHKMTQQFELVTQRLFEEKSTKFTDQNLKSLQSLLEPLRERIKDFERKVDETYKSESTDRGILRGELSKLLELNRTMSTEAQNLTKALKGEVKTQGNWGEMILENILERSGLTKGVEYTVQGSDLGSLRNSDDEVIRPDIIINLPEGKHLILDAKMTLQAYEAFTNAETQEEQDQHAKAHTDSLKRHIDGLAARRYTTSDQLQTPDFVMLFMPLEPAFALAMRLRPDLLHYAWEKHIALVSPTTLLTTLRTVSALWKQDRQQKNAMEIAKRGGALYEKFCGLVDDLETLGERMDQSQRAYEVVLTKLSDGRGNLIAQVEELKELGAKTERKVKRVVLNEQKQREREERAKIREEKRLAKMEKLAAKEIEKLASKDSEKIESPEFLDEQSPS